MKKIVRITENKLNRIIVESVKNILNEASYYNVVTAFNVDTKFKNDTDAEKYLMTGYFDPNNTRDIQTDFDDWEYIDEKTHVELYKNKIDGQYLFVKNDYNAD